MRNTKRKTLAQKKADQIKPKGRSKYGKKKALQKKGKYSAGSPKTLVLNYERILILPDEERKKLLDGSWDIS